MKEQSFGIEIEMTGITRRRAAQALAEHFGTSVEFLGGTYDAYGVTDTDGRKWKLVSDSSIRAESSEEQTEFVSPICYWKDIELVQALVRKLRKAGAKTDPSCGIHVHVGRGEHTARTLRNLMNIVSAKEDLLIQALGIQGERLSWYCRRTDPRVLAALNRVKPRTDDQFARIWYTHDGSFDRDYRTRMHRHYDESRYHLLNLHSVFQKGTIEFRAFECTLHAGKIKSYIQLCLAISYQALKSSAASPRKTVTDNPKYTFRCWLLRLGFIGDEFKTARTHLLANLEGNSAWRQAG